MKPSSATPPSSTTHRVGIALTMADIDHYEKTGEHPSAMVPWTFRYAISEMARVAFTRSETATRTRQEAVTLFCGLATKFNVENGLNLSEPLRRTIAAFADACASRSATPKLEAVGLFWQTADGRWHLCEGATRRGDIHDNGRPIRIAYMGEEAPK